MFIDKAFYGIESDFFVKSGCGYTAGEIAQQPVLWNELSMTLQRKKDEITAFMSKIGNLSRVRIILTGAGSSGFIGDALSALLAKNAGIRSESIHTTDIVSAPKSYLFAGVPTLLVSFARSGNSPESTGAVKYARAVIKDLFEVAIVCDDKSNLNNLTEQSANSLILAMPEGANDKGFAMTSSVSCMLLTGFALFSPNKISDIIKDIALLSRNTSAAGLRFAASAKKLAEMDFDRVVYLGCGFLKHLAHEASLKMMELTQGRVNGSHESATGFRHGPKSVINDKTLTVHMVSNDPFTAKYDIDILREVCSQRKRNMIVTVCGDNVNMDTGTAPVDEMVTVDAGGYGIGGDICTGLQTLVFCQMLAMFKSLSLGVTTDDPVPNGELNRVVKGVTVYDL